MEGSPAASHVRRTKRTTRRSGERRGTPYLEVTETTEEVTTRPVAGAKHSTSRSSTRRAPDAGRLQVTDQEHGRLQGGGAAEGARTQPQSSTSRTPLNIAGGEEGRPSQRPLKSLSAKQQTPHSQPLSSTKRPHHRTAHRAVESGLIESSPDMGMEDYDTPVRTRGGGRLYAYGQPSESSVPSRRPRGSRPNVSNVVLEDTSEEESNVSYHFRVRIHCYRGVFADLEEVQRPAPVTYMALHTAEERGHSGETAGGIGEYDGVFNDEFIFTSSDPLKDALVCTLVAVARDGGGRDKKVAECVLSFRNIQWQVEREVWVPLVRHPGTTKAYEQGELLVSIHSEDFGYETVPTAEEEAACSAAIGEMLQQYAPEELHRLDWLSGEYAMKGPQALAQLKASYRGRNTPPVQVRLGVKSVSGLVDRNGRPSDAETCFVVVNDGRGEQRSKVVPYRRVARIQQDFSMVLQDPASDTMNVAVYSAGHKLGEVVVGLTNVQAGKSKELTLMLVCAAETGDASNGGEVVLTLRTDTFSSPYQISAQREARLRERVLAYLWLYLRDDLHRLDAIVAHIDNEEEYMREWSRTVGPEPEAKDLTIRVRAAHHLFSDGQKSGLPQRCYVRIAAGPNVARTDLSVVRSGAVSFNSKISVKVYDASRDAVELMVVEESDAGEQEVSRVTVGVSSLPHQRMVTRTLHLVTNAMKRTAAIQGDLVVELTAENFGLTGRAAEAVLRREKASSSTNVQRLEAITQRSSPEMLHRVPYMLDTVTPGEEEKVVKEQAKEHGNEVAVAPMTLRLLGVREFRPSCDFYVKAYLGDTPILRTADLKGGTNVTMDIDENNEETVRLKGASQSTIFFKIAQHRSLRKTKVLGQAEIALASLVRGEKNVLWLPFFSSNSSSTSSSASASCLTPNTNSVKVKGNVMPRKTRQVPRHGGATFGGTDTTPVGILGVELQSTAFPSNTVTMYKLNGGTGSKRSTAHETVTADVASLVAKFDPSSLAKVQPMVTQCSSLREAHQELRERLCPYPVAATVYLHIDAVEMATPEGRTQESHCGVAVVAVCGAERQVSHKVVDFTDDVLNERRGYRTIRLDLMDPTASGGGGAGRQCTSDTEGPALELHFISEGVQQLRTRSASGTSAPLLAIPFNSSKSRRTTPTRVSPRRGPTPLVGAPGSITHDTTGTSAYDNDADVEPYYIGGENNINSYLKSPQRSGRRWSIRQPDEGRSGSPSIIRRQQEEMHANTPLQTNGPKGFTKDGLRRGSGAANSAVMSSPSTSFQLEQQQLDSDDGGYWIGGANNIRSYMGSPARSPSRQRALLVRSPERRRRHRSNDDPPSWSRRRGDEAKALGKERHARDAVMTGDIGTICLSLKALLTSPVYSIGDTVRVPIIAARCCSMASRHGEVSAAVNRQCIVGHVTMRLTLPEFEKVPECLRLPNRHSITGVAPVYLHYFERRIAAQLREYNAPDLRRYHYIFYERNVASGSWPVSLQLWLKHLVERYGPETDHFGPVPPLSFTPDELERARKADAALHHRQEEMYSPSEPSYTNGYERQLRPSSAPRHGQTAQRRNSTDKQRSKLRTSGRTAGKTPPPQPVYSF